LRKISRRKARAARSSFLAAQLAKRGIRYHNWIFPGGTENAKNADLHLVPLNLMSAKSASKVRILIDETLFQPDREPLLLRENDLMLLEREGFTLPKLLDHRRQMNQILERASRSSGIEGIYSSFPDSSKLLPLEWSSLQKVAPPTSAQEPRSTQGILLASRRPLSATQLETYSKCPSQYLFSQVMRWRKKLSPQDQYALIFGQASHSALEHFFEQESGRESILREPEGAKARLMELFKSALEEGENPVPSTSSASVMWQQHFQRLCDRLPGMERQLVEVFGTRRVVAVEKQFTLSVAGSEVTGKIDRIDEREDGSLLVLDYKTGTIDFTPDHISKGSHFQALLYVLGAEKELRRPVAGMLFYDLKQGELKRGILREESFAKEVKKAVTRGHLLPAIRWESVMGEGTACLERLASAISSGEFSPTPSAKNCQYCDFVAMCRKAVGYA
jgi:ATP-dependent helicase/DNAse subunit B